MKDKIAQRAKKSSSDKRKKRTKIQFEYIDMRSVFDHVGVHYWESGKNVSDGWIGIQCPFPGCDDHSNHCGVCLTSPVVTCYKCGTKGNYLTALGVILGSFPKAIDILQKFTPRELRHIYEKEENEYNVTKVELPEGATKEYNKYHAAYVRSRGFDIDSITKLYDWYFCGPGIEGWENRIIVPIYDRNRMVTFTSIDIAEESELRYKHLAKESSIIHCKNYLYGLEQSTGRTAIIVEGYFDKLRIGPGSLATFGTQITALQKKLMARFDNLVILFDGDGPGWKAGEKLANDMASHCNTKLITLPEGIDPDSLPKEDIKELQRMVRTKW